MPSYYSSEGDFQTVQISASQSLSDLAMEGKASLKRSLPLAWEQQLVQGASLYLTEVANHSLRPSQFTALQININ